MLMLRETARSAAAGRATGHEVARKTKQKSREAPHQTEANHAVRVVCCDSFLGGMFLFRL